MADLEPFEPIVSAADRQAFVQYIGGQQGFRIWFQSWVLDVVNEAFEGHAPSKLRDFYSMIQDIEAGFSRDLNAPYQVPVSHLPLVRRAVLHYRYQIALQQERLRNNYVDPKHATEIDALTDRVDSDLDRPWLKTVIPIARPRLTEYINLKTARSILQSRGAGKRIERLYDDKFGILWPSSKCNDAIEMARLEAWLLGTAICVAYIDIDDFKSVNTRATEMIVDREVLPPFMLLLEAHTSSRGYAFRYGGDEYVVVLPDSDIENARLLLDRLRDDIERRAFGAHNITVSIGFFVASDDCSLTNTEILQRANTAKNEAKRKGKNRLERALG